MAQRAHVEPLDHEQLLRTANLRVTKPRLAVMATLHDLPHSDTSAVLDEVRGRHTNVSHQAVYDCLAALTDAGLVRRIQPRGQCARYELRVGDNHHHAVCRECGSISDVDCAVGVAPCLDTEGPLGFTVDEAEVVYWGVCPACQDPAAPHSPTPIPN